MSNLNISVRSLLIPMVKEQMLLPNASLAEIITYTQPRALKNSPDWMLGMLPWRGMDVPLVSFESIQGGKTEIGQGSRIAIINALGGDSDLPFFAMLVQGIPHLVLANQSVVTALADQKASQEGVLSHVLIEAEPAIIPDLDGIESTLLKQKSLLK